MGDCQRKCDHGFKCIISPPFHQVHHFADECYHLDLPNGDAIDFRTDKRDDFDLLWDELFEGRYK